MRTITPALLVIAVAACGQTPAEQTRELASVVKRAITEPERPGSGELEYRVHQLVDATLEGEVSAASCDAVDQELAAVCGELYHDGTVSSCGYTTAFFYAHVTPRCAVRFEVWRPGDTGPLHDVHVLDFAGAPLVGPAPSCGNGALDDGEVCDDGNHESWDGCDANCNQEEFQGCEHVVEEVFARANIADIDSDAWEGPRSHLMVHHDARALEAMDSARCDDAIEAANEVCTELTRQMPFVSYCQPAGVFHDEDGAASCSLRLQVWFHQLDDATGVFTTSLPGLLAFTIR